MFLVEWFHTNADSVQYVCYSTHEVSPLSTDTLVDGYVQFREDHTHDQARRHLCGDVLVEQPLCNAQSTYNVLERMRLFTDFGEPQNIVPADNECVRRRLFPDGSDRKIHVEVVFGPAGSGKSTYANAVGNSGFGDMYNITGDELLAGNTFCGYFGQKTLIIEDFFDDCVDIRFLQRMLDVCPLRVGVVYGTVMYAQWETVIITSEQEMLFGQEPDHQVGLLMERITHVYDLTKLCDRLNLADKTRQLERGHERPERRARGPYTPLGDASNFCE